MREVVRVQLGEQVFAQTLTEGRTMMPEQALSAQGHTLLSSHPPTKSITSPETDHHQLPSPSSPNDLTEREEEVLPLVA